MLHSSLKFENQSLVLTQKKATMKKNEYFFFIFLT